MGKKSGIFKDQFEEKLYFPDPKGIWNSGVDLGVSEFC